MRGWAICPGGGCWGAAQTTPQLLMLQACSAWGWGEEALKGQGLQQPLDDVECPVAVATGREGGSDHGARYKERGCFDFGLYSGF